MVWSVVRLPQALHHGVFGDGAVHRQGDQGAQQGKHRSHRQDGGQGEAVGEEPEHALKGGEGQGAQDHRQDQGQEHRAQGVQQALTDQHGLQLLSGHADGLEDGHLAFPGDDAGEDGVEEVQHPYQAHDAAEGPAQQQEHGSHPLKLRGVGGLALIVELGIHIFRVVRQEGLHGGVGLIRGVEGIVHDAVRARVLDEGLVVHDELIRAVIAVAQGHGHGHQGGHLVLHVPVLHRPVHPVGTIGHVLPWAVHLSGVGIIVLIFLHIPDGDGVPQPGPVGAHLGPAVVVIAVHSGYIPPAGFTELGQVSLQHRQVVQGELLHAVELHPVGQQALLIAVLEVDHAVQLLGGVPAAPDGAVVLLGDELQRSGGLSVDQAAAGDAALGVDGGDHVLRHVHLVVIGVAAGLKLARVGHDEVAGSEVGDILVHVKALGEGDRQGQREDGDRRLAPAAAQVGPGHGEEGDALGSALGFAFQVPALGVAHRLDGGDPGGHFSRLAAGEKNGHQGKQGGGRKNDRVH